MIDNKQKSKSAEKSAASTLAAAVTGAVVGAGVVAAGIVAMQNDKNRDKAKKIIDGVKAKASAYMKTAEDQVEEGKEKLDKTADVAKGSGKKVKKYGVNRHHHRNSSYFMVGWICL